MKKILFKVSVLFLLISSTASAQVTNAAGEILTTNGAAPNGGFGYRFNASSNWGGTGANTNPAVYDWIDISSTGTRVTGLGDDNIIGPIPLGIDFKYFWNSYNSCFVGSNGYIMFGDNALIAQGSAGLPNIPVQTDGKGNFIAPYLADLTFISHATGQTLPGAKVLYQTIGNQFIITYDSVRFWNNGAGSDEAEATGLSTFQIILDGVTNNIKINYQYSVGPWFTGSTGVFSMGMENVSGGLGCRWRRKATAATTLPPANSAVRVLFPTTSTYTFKDVQARAIFTPDNKGGTAFTSIPKTISAYVRNAGTVKVSSPINARIVISDYNDNGIYNQTVVLDSLQQGEERLVNFPVPLNPGDTAGNFKVSLTTSTVGDQFSGNNTKITKLVVLDSTQGSVDLKFTSPRPGTVPSAGLSLNSGMIFDPPYQPMVISKISVDMVWPDSLGWANSQFAVPDVKDSLTDMKIEVYIGDGPGGAIGTLLDSFTIRRVEDFEHFPIGQELSIAGDTLNRIIRVNRVLPNPISWFNGARIYAGGIQLGRTTRFAWNTLYSETYRPGFPASGRSLEIAGGVWGENRGKDSIDIAIGLIGDPLAVAVKSVVRVQEVQMEQNIPNPASGKTSISFSLPSAGPVSLVVRDALGREVISKSLQGIKGAQVAELDIHHLKPALYFYSVTHASGSATRRMIVK